MMLFHQFYKLAWHTHVNKKKLRKKCIKCKVRYIVICLVPTKSSFGVFSSKETQFFGSRMCLPEVSVCLTPLSCRLLPKSARWLMANNQKEEAWQLIQKAAQMNGVCQSKDLEMLRVRVQVYLGLFLF